MKRPERLWDQYFGKAEAEGLRGSGRWPLQPHPCSLQPPWDEFDRRNLSLWDCMVCDWEAPYERSLLGRVFANGKVYESGTPVLLPEVPWFDPQGLVPIVVEQFPEDETTIPKSEEFLRSLSHLTALVSFELVGIGKQPEYDLDQVQQRLKDPAGKRRIGWINETISGYRDPYITTQFVARRQDADTIERLLTTHYPNSSVVRKDQIDDDFDSIPTDIMHEDGRAFTLSLTHYYCWPLRIFTRLDPDPLGVAISAMEHLGQWDWALVQILFEPTYQPWQQTLTEAVTPPYDNELLLSDLSDRVLREKYSSPLFAVSVRIAARQEHVFRQLLGWAEQFARPPQAFDFVPEDFELLSRAIRERCTFRPGVLLNVQELASLVHLPGQSIASECLRRVASRTRPAAETKSERGSVLLGENVHQGKRRQARIPAKLRSRHCYIAGASGTGKSTLLLNMILQDMEAGEGVGLLDPHGDLVKEVLRRVPEDRIDDVILFDPSDKEYPFALNLLDVVDGDEREMIVAETLTALERNFPDGWGHRMERILSYALYTVLDTIPGATLLDVERMLVNHDFRRETVMKCRTERFAGFWHHEFGTMPKNATDPILNRLNQFLLHDTVRKIVCQRRSAINFDKLLNGRKILLANLSSGVLTEKIASMFGSFLVSKIIAAAFRRAAIPEERRVPWYLYIDEFQAFMNLSLGFDRILAEARKYKLVLAGLANQYVGQLSQPVREAVFGNVGTMLTFRLGVNDARTIEKEMGIFTADEILNLEVGEAIARAGSSKTAFNLTTAPPPEPSEVDPTARIMEMSRQKYAVHESQIDDPVEQYQKTERPAPTESHPSQPPIQQKRRKSKRKPQKLSENYLEPTDPSEDDLVN